LHSLAHATHTNSALLLLLLLHTHTPGKPDFTQFPSILLSGTGFVSMKTGPDGYIYGIDFQNGRYVSLRCQESSFRSLFFRVWWFSAFHFLL
jgi:hypothetical protein